MKCKTRSSVGLRILVIIIWSGGILPSASFAHCDTLNGPVVAEAQAALENGDVTPVLTLHDTIAAGETHHGHAE
jgi:hypothetical protein